MEKIKAAPIIETLCAYSSYPELISKILRLPGAFFLDGGERLFDHSRYSFLGTDPFLVFTCTDNDISLTGDGIFETVQTDPFEYVKKLLGRYEIESREELPPFPGGAVGYFGYDMGRRIEDIPVCAIDDISIPDCYLGFYSSVVIVDHMKKKIMIAASGFPEESARMQRSKAKSDMERLALLLTSHSKAHVPDVFPSMPPAMCSNFTRETYSESIFKIKEYIAAGDVYQVNLSQRFSCSSPIQPAHLYETLRTVSPAPYSCFLNCGDHHILSASPERFLRMSGSSVETKPIKGTRPRGTTKDSDVLMREELLASKKDRAELLMIIDLERNDLGRVCRFGSIHPSPLFSLEAYANVYHMVSTIKGKLENGCEHVDCLKACFPGGSITGAPKIRAMEIIEELEPCRRKVYTGSIGYLGFNNESDLNIAIRTMLHKDGTYWFNVGGGIVADSDPDMEYDETLHKGRGIMEALGAGEYAAACLL